MCIYVPAPSRGNPPSRRRTETDPPVCITIIGVVSVHIWYYYDYYCDTYLSLHSLFRFQLLCITIIGVVSVYMVVIWYYYDYYCET
jgi:hypothetical protein